MPNGYTTAGLAGMKMLANRRGTYVPRFCRSRTSCMGAQKHALKVKRKSSYPEIRALTPHWIWLRSKVHNREQHPRNV